MKKMRENLGPRPENLWRTEQDETYFYYLFFSNRVHMISYLSIFRWPEVFNFSSWLLLLHFIIIICIIEGFLLREVWTRERKNERKRKREWQNERSESEVLSNLEYSDGRREKWNKNIGNELWSAACWYQENSNKKVECLSCSVRHTWQNHWMIMRKIE